MRFLILLLLAASCSPIYVPTTRNVPLFRGAGEFQASAYLTTGADVQAAYALTDHLGVTGSYSILSQKQDLPKDPNFPNTPADFQRKNSFGEIGLGYYNSTRSSRFELYGGYGVGEGTSYATYAFFPSFGPRGIVATGKYHRYYIQPSFGTNSKKFNLIFTMRLSAVEFSDFTSDGFIGTTITKKPTDPLHIFANTGDRSKFFYCFCFLNSR